MSLAPVEALDIVDCHHHFWDLSEKNHPWLCDPVPVHFRYGDYSSIKRNYFPADYRRDVAPYRVVKTVHEEAWWDRRNPVAETRWLEGIAAEHGLPNACVAAAWPARDDIEEVLVGHAKSKLVRGIRNFPMPAPSAREAKRGEAGSMDDPKWRLGYALLSRYGFSFDLQVPWWHMDAASELAADFPKTQIVIVHAGLPIDRSAEGLARLAPCAGAGRGLSQCRDQGFGSGRAQPALDAGIQWPGDSRRDQDIRRRPRNVRKQFPGRFDRRLVQDDL